MPLPAVSRLLRPALRTQLVPIARVSAKPAKHDVTAGAQAIALATLFVAVLFPSSWVLAHLEDYRTRK